MVFTNVPSSLFVIAVLFAPSFKPRSCYFFAAKHSSRWMFPTRQSYVAAAVLPNERTFASGFTNLARNVVWADGSSFAGLVMQNLAFSAPLVIDGGMKVAYDVALYIERFGSCGRQRNWSDALYVIGIQTTSVATVSRAPRIQRTFRFSR
jgi:predicted MFS family arabinose efflux permease